MKRDPNIIRRTALAFLAPILILLPANAIAGMAVSPLQQWVEVKPGKQTSFSIIVTNTNRGPQTRPCTVDVEVVDFTVSPQGGLSFGEEHKHSRSAIELISFDDSDFVLEPGESKEIKAKVSAPLDADGDYWAAVLVKLGNPRESKGGVAVRLQTASGVFVHVARRNYIERGTVIDANVVIPEFDLTESFTEESDCGQTPQDAQKQQALKINAELRNDGLVAFLANGKAFLYSESWRRLASIPLYTSRRRILPGHSRYFTGVMSQPLLAGQYKLRVFFDSDSKYERKITEDMEFSVSDELARQWAKNFTNDDIQILDIKPQEFKLTLTTGRFTAARFLVANQSLSTVSIRCGFETDRLPKDWVELKSAEFTLAPNMRRNVVCSIRIPQDAQPGEYRGTICVEVERPGLTGQGKSNVELHKIPIRIAVSKYIATNK